MEADTGIPPSPQCAMSPCLHPARITSSTLFLYSRESLQDCLGPGLGPRLQATQAACEPALHQSVQARSPCVWAAATSATCSLDLWATNTSDLADLPIRAQGLATVDTANPHSPHQSPCEIWPLFIFFVPPPTQRFGLLKSETLFSMPDKKGTL